MVSVSRKRWRRRVLVDAEWLVDVRVLPREQSASLAHVCCAVSHRSQVRQFHVEPDGKVTVDWSLGSFAATELPKYTSKGGAISDVHVFTDGQVRLAARPFGNVRHVTHRDAVPAAAV